MLVLGDVGFRPIEAVDLEKARRLRNDPSTWIYLGGVDHVTPQQQAEWFCSLQDDKTRAYYTAFMNVIDPDFPIATEGDFLGVIRTDEIDRQNRSIRVGLDIDPGKRGQGWATKLYCALLKWLFDFKGYHRVHLAVLDSNVVGLKLYLNSGFREEGRQRQAIWRDGAWRDYVLMSILEDEYRSRA